MKQIILQNLISNFPECEFKGNKDHVVTSVVGLTPASGKNLKSSISWMSDSKGSSFDPGELQLGLLILSKKMFEKFNSLNCNFLLAENPRACFAKILSLYFKKEWPTKTESTAVIGEDTQIGSNCYIGHHVVIEKGCVVGNNTVILHNTVILENTIIGNNVLIGCNNTIGNYGFGYEKNSDGNYELLEHLGKVVINNDVEIHNNTCIDRGVLSDTEIHENVKIDNLVHIAHGVIIEKNALIIANAMVGGSARIGENSWIAPSVSIKNQIKVANDTMTGIGAVILKDTAEKSVMIGNPAITMEEHKKWSEAKKKIT